MAVLTWSNVSPIYERGVEKGVLYLPGKPGVAWSGLVSVDEDITGGDTKSRYFDGKKYDTQAVEPDLGLKVAAWMYPREFEACLGYANPEDGQPKTRFGMSYQTGGTQPRIHLIYNAIVEAEAVEYESIDTEIDPTLFAWNVATTPFDYALARPSSHVIIDLTETYSEVQTKLLQTLYGTASAAPKLPTLAELYTIYEANAIFRVTDNGAGIATITGPDSYVQQINSTTYQLSGSTVVQINSTTYQISNEL